MSTHCQSCRAQVELQRRSNGSVVLLDLRPTECYVTGPSGHRHALEDQDGAILEVHIPHALTCPHRRPDREPTDPGCRRGSKRPKETTS